VCPGCGISVAAATIPAAARYQAAADCLQHFHTLAGIHFDEADASFKHQIAIDCYGAQHIGGPSKPVTAVYALVGLCLHVERGFSGRQIQAAHMLLARTRSNWPTLSAPATHYRVTVDMVVAAGCASSRAQQLEAWAVCTWEAWRNEQQWVRNIIRDRRLAA
jgi:hypothetical protein